MKYSDILSGATKKGIDTAKSYDIFFLSYMQAFYRFEQISGDRQKVVQLTDSILRNGQIFASNCQASIINQGY